MTTKFTNDEIHEMLDRIETEMFEIAYPRDPVDASEIDSDHMKALKERRAELLDML